LGRCETPKTVAERRAKESQLFPFFARRSFLEQRIAFCVPDRVGVPHIIQWHPLYTPFKRFVFHARPHFFFFLLRASESVPPLSSTPSFAPMDLSD
jgi:hypothetical protein